MYALLGSKTKQAKDARTKLGLTLAQSFLIFQNGISSSVIPPECAAADSGSGAR